MNFEIEELYAEIENLKNKINKLKQEEGGEEEEEEIIEYAVSLDFDNPDYKYFDTLDGVVKFLKDSNAGNFKTYNKRELSYVTESDKLVPLLRRFNADENHTSSTGPLPLNDEEIAYIEKKTKHGVQETEEKTMTESSSEKMLVMRMGDNAEYEEFHSIDEVANNIIEHLLVPLSGYDSLEDMVKEFKYHENALGLTGPGYEDYNYISLYWGTGEDETSEETEPLSNSEVKELFSELTRLAKMYDEGKTESVESNPQTSADAGIYQTPIGGKKIMKRGKKAKYWPEHSEDKTYYVSKLKEKLNESLEDLDVKRMVRTGNLKCISSVLVESQTSGWITEFGAMNSKRFVIYDKNKIYVTEQFSSEDSKNEFISFMETYSPYNISEISMFEDIKETVNNKCNKLRNFIFESFNSLTENLMPSNEFSLKNSRDIFQVVEEKMSFNLPNVVFFKLNDNTLNLIVENVKNEEHLNISNTIKENFSWVEDVKASGGITPKFLIYSKYGIKDEFNENYDIASLLESAEICERYEKDLPEIKKRIKEGIKSLIQRLENEETYQEA